MKRGKDIERARIEAVVTLLKERGPLTAQQIKAEIDERIFEGILSKYVEFKSYKTIFKHIANTHNIVWNGGKYYVV